MADGGESGAQRAFGNAGHAHFRIEQGGEPAVPHRCLNNASPTDVAPAVASADAVAGLVAFAGVVLAANGYAEQREEWGRQGRIVRPGWIYRIPVAPITNDLAPLIDNLPGKNGGMPRVIGYDGQYTRNAPGALAIFVLPRDAGNDGELESLSAGFETFHPVLFHGAEGERAMWQEGEHRPESRYAHNVIWASPDVMRGKRVTEYERYRDEIERVIA